MAQIRNRPPGSPWRVVFIGQSIPNSPSPYIGGVESIPWLLMSGRGIPWANVSYNAAGWDDWVSTHLSTLCLPQLGHADADLVVMLDSGQSDIWDGTSGATTYSRMVSISQTIKASYPSTHVMATTLIGNGTNTGAQETARAALNSAIMGDASNAFDTSLDIDVAPVADWTNTTYYVDGIHPNAAGCAAIAAVIDSTLDAILV